MPRKQTAEKELVVSASVGSAVPARRKPAVTARKKREVAGAASAVAAPVVEPESKVVSVVAVEPAFEEIAQLAYSYWEARGCQGGSPEQDWLRAEAELRQRA